MYHVRANTSDPEVARLARAFGANVYLSGTDEGSLRRTTCADGVPTITIEMGRAQRFQADLIERARVGVGGVLAEYGMLPGAPVVWPGWRRLVDEASAKTWLRANTAGLVEMEYDSPFVRGGGTICAITNHFKTRETVVTAPFTGLVVGTLENPVAAPGQPALSPRRRRRGDPGGDSAGDTDRRVPARTAGGVSAEGSRRSGDGRPSRREVIFGSRVAVAAFPCERR